MVDLNKEIVEVTFDKENEFFDLLETLKTTDKLRKTEIGDLELTTESDGEVCSTGLYLKRDEEIFRIPESALFSIRRRFKNMSEILPKMTAEDQAKMLNMSIVYLKDNEAKLYTRGDLVVGLHSDHYAAIRQYDLYSAFRDNLMLSYDEFCFLSGTYRHDVTEAIYKVVDLDTSGRYVKALIDAGKRVGLADIEFRIALRTSDAATCSVSVQPYVFIKGRKSAPLSQAMRLDHRDGVGMQEVRDIFLKTYSYNSDAVDNLAEMLQITLTYPSSVIRRLTKKYRLPLRPMKSIASRFAVEERGLKMSAHDLYINACLAMRDEKFTKMSEERQIEMQDAFSKILKTTKDEWQRMDKPGPTLLDE